MQADVSWAWNRIFSDYQERAAVYTDPRLPDNPIEYATPAYCNMTGYAPEEIVGRSCLFLQGPDTDDRTVATILTALAKWRSATVDILNYRKDGTSFWNRMAIKPVFGSGSVVDRWIAVHSAIDV